MRNLKWPYIPILFYYVLYLSMKFHACSIQFTIHAHIGWANYVNLLFFGNNVTDVHIIQNSLIF